MIATAALLVLAQAASPSAGTPSAAGPTANNPLADRITFELVISGVRSSGWEIRGDESGDMFDLRLVDGQLPEGPEAPPAEEGRHSRRDPFTASAGTFSFSRQQLEKYRQHALPGTGCAIRKLDVIAFRLTWIEQGARATATYADSCGGVPTDLIETIAPIGQRIDRALPPPFDGEPHDDDADDADHADHAAAAAGTGAGE